MNAPKKPLVKTEAATLYKIVRLTEEKRGVFPTIAEIAVALDIEYGAARGRLRRLITNGYIRELGKGKWEVNKEEICDKRETAQFLLLIFELARQGGKVSKADLFSRALADPRNSMTEKHEVERLLQQAINADYVEQPLSDPQYIYPKRLIVDQWKFLSLLAEDC